MFALTLNPGTKPPLFLLVAELKMSVWMPDMVLNQNRYNQNHDNYHNCYLDAGHGVEAGEDEHEGEAEEEHVELLHLEVGEVDHMMGKDSQKRGEFVCRIITLRTRNTEIRKRSTYLRLKTSRSSPSGSMLKRAGS